MQINRDGKVIFSDAKFIVREDPKESPIGAGWEKAFKREVFKRIVQQLNRIGWTVEVPQEMVEKYSLSFARNYRTCSYGDLRAELSLCGRCIEFEVWQGVNTPTRPDHGGRYESDKERVMPYLLRLRMERTRRKIRDYLCGVFSGYTFVDKSPITKEVSPRGKTAIQAIQDRIEGSWHYRADLGRASIHGVNDISADGFVIEHGKSKVYAFDRKGRAITGTAFFDLNGNWIIHTGKYGRSWHWHNTIYVNNPGDLKRKRNSSLRRKRLEGELSEAIKRMDFLRAHTLKGILFPASPQLYMVRNHEGYYHRANFCGYTTDATEAGKFESHEIGSYRERNDVIPVREAVLS
ncbi:hypothetical protein [Gilvimarinus chinensis]|uniref:hypothetical protein n=1 Tax=Gilvimarinus chinensis TaxID=396005 RepID=UPI00035F47E4|nr:hypothetical protein [Gilvimarinus chinensis]